MPPWLTALIVTTVIGVIVGAIVKFSGRSIFNWIKTVFTVVALGATMDRNRMADEEYRITMSATIDALKERITLLERWRQEAQELENRVDGLEEEIRELRKKGLSKDDEIIRATSELINAKRELKEKENSINELMFELVNEKNLVSQLQIQLAEAEAVQADNKLKIGALLHQASGGSGDV